MSDNNSNRAKKGKPKMFLLFLIVATLIWFLTKFSREFTSHVEAEINYYDVPHGIVIDDENYKTVSFDLTTSGFDFLFYKINKPVIDINIQQYYNAENEFILISNNDFKRIITSQLKNDNIIKNVSIETMKIYLDKLDTKKVKVSLIEDIQFMNGYRAVGDFKISPDSIAISGPVHYLDTLTEIFTKPLKLKEVSDNLSTTIDLYLPDNASMKFSHSSVNLELKVKEFTQKTLSIPVIIENLPSDLTINLMPENVNISFDVAMEDFNKINVSEFKIICDFNKKNIEESFMIPQIGIQPEFIYNLEIKDNKVNYLIIK